MGLFDRLRGNPSQILALPGGADVEVKGEAGYQGALSAICGGRSSAGHHRPVRALLVREPSNTYDPNAVKVTVRGRLVGYLSRPEAARYAPALDLLAGRGLTGECDATIVGGWDRGDGDTGHFGIWLRLAGPDEIRALVS